LDAERSEEVLALIPGEAVPAFVAGREELRGDLLMRLGRKAEARTAYEKARAAMPQDAGLGVLQTKLDDLADKEARGGLPQLILREP
jgi:predicted negative regulator of RcsB-dependent stress response